MLIPRQQLVLLEPQTQPRFVVAHIIRTYVAYIRALRRSNHSSTPCWQTGWLTGSRSGHRPSRPLQEQLHAQHTRNALQCQNYQMY
jgi:hypothetical protein